MWGWADPAELQNELDLADIRGETGAAIHAASIAGRGRRPKGLTVGSRCDPGDERLENIVGPRAQTEPHIRLSRRSELREIAEGF
jgi:hypothetical protein